MEGYQRYIADRPKADGLPLAVSSQQSLLTPLRVFFRWVERQRIVHNNPTRYMELPSSDFILPREIPSPAQVRRILAQPDTRWTVRLRDRTILAASS